MKVVRGDIYYANLYGIENQQIGTKPVVVISNNQHNKHSNIITVVPLTSKHKELWSHVVIEGCGLKRTSMALLEQTTAINKSQLIIEHRVGKLSSVYLDKIDEAMDKHLGRIKRGKAKDAILS